MAAPDRQIQGGRGGRGGGWHPDPEIRGWSGLKNQFFGPSSLSLV